MGKDKGIIKNLLEILPGVWLKVTVPKLEKRKRGRVRSNCLFQLDHGSGLIHAGKPYLWKLSVKCPVHLVSDFLGLDVWGMRLPQVPGGEIGTYPLLGRGRAVPGCLRQFTVFTLLLRFIHSHYQAGLLSLFFSFILLLTYPWASCLSLSTGMPLKGPSLWTRAIWSSLPLSQRPIDLPPGLISLEKLSLFSWPPHRRVFWPIFIPLINLTFNQALKEMLWSWCKALLQTMLQSPLAVMLE